ncbi:hypothetical protein [Microcoleus sp. C2C6]|uniref:hypothetical protein n=1 Tax=Microcoleus sp. C2C6 TaxID=3055325 RepID=UPI002FD4D96E
MPLSQEVDGSEEDIRKMESTTTAVAVLSSTFYLPGIAHQISSQPSGILPVLN